MSLLAGELLQSRRWLLSSAALDTIDDVVHAFFACRRCARTLVSLTTLTFHVHRARNNLAALARILLERPEQMGIETTTTRCTCGAIMQLDAAVLCRTNPRQGNDFHLRVRYAEQPDPYAAAILFRDGRYVQLPPAQLARLLCPTPLGDRLRALREPRPEIDDEERRTDAYFDLVQSGELPQALLRDLLRDLIDRLLAQHDELRAEPVVQEALAIVALPIDHHDLEARSQAIDEPMGVLRRRYEAERPDDEVISIALQAVHNAAWLVPAEAVVEASANAVQHAAASARRDLVDGALGVAREVTAQIDALLRRTGAA